MTDDVADALDGLGDGAKTFLKTAPDYAEIQLLGPSLRADLIGAKLVTIGFGRTFKLTDLGRAAKAALAAN